MLDPVQVKAMLQKWVAVVAFIAKWTPSTVDDKIVGFLQLAVENDDVIALLVDLINKFSSAKVSGTEFNLHAEVKTSVNNLA